MIAILSIKQPKNFSFDACLNFLDRGYNECLYYVNDKFVRRLIRIDSGLVFIQVSSYDGFLEVSSTRKVNLLEKKEIQLYIIDWFDLNRDISDFYQLLESYDETKGFSKNYYGLRLMGIVDLFEALCWCIMGQQINLTFAHKMKTRLVHKYGDKLSYEGFDYYCFPLPKSMLNADREELAIMQFSKQKIAYIENISKAFFLRELNKGILLNLTRKQQMDKLLAIKGIGPWTANYVSMKSLRNMSCIAYGDTGLSAALHKHFCTAKKPDKLSIDKIFSAFAGWESYLNFYLWKSLS